MSRFHSGGRGSAEVTKVRLDARHSILVVFLVAAVVLGGSSVAGLTSLLQLVSILVALGTIIRWRWTGKILFDPLLALILAVLAGTFLVQLIPFRPELWGSLPGRASLIADYALLGMEPPWLPVTLDPLLTLDTLLAWPPVLAVVLICGGLARLAPRVVGWAVIGAGGLSLFLGIAQAQGGRREALFVHTPNFETAMGFFANPNHLATLLLICVPVTAALLREGSDRSWRLSGLRYPFFAGVVTLAFSALALTRSMGGIVLLIPTAAASFILLGAPKRWLLLAAGASSLAIGGWMLSSDWEKFVSENTSLGTAELDRGGIALRSMAIVRDTFPVGSGLGTFRDVYKLYEDPMSVGPKWVNRAHNEYLELVVEAGLVGAVLVLLIWLWWLVRSFAVWRAGDGGDPWSRAASIVVGVVLIHSFVDYPARMPAIAVILTYFVLLLSAKALPGREEGIGLEGAAAFRP